jgi:hypothetical protein
MVRISNPLRDDPDIHARLDQALKRLGRQPIETVANTIFPAALAARSRDHAQLVSRYLAMYETIHRLSPKPWWGTYFGRLIAYPSPQHESPFDQVGAVISWLSKESAYPSGKTARYEIAIAHPLDSEGVDPRGPDAATYSVPVQLPGTDTRAMGTPCLSHCSFQLDRRSRAVHALATYRSHYMTERAYGNYLGLGRLLGYIASQSGLEAGTLTVVAGYAQIEHGTITQVRPLLSSAASPTS